MDLATKWSELKDELDNWNRSGQIATFWWRDDDAVTVTPALGRALMLAKRYAAPIHLSVIPARMSADFGRELTDDAPTEILQHGFAHAEGELYGDRKPEDVLAELAAGRDILSRALGKRFLKVLVPPWNLIRDEFIPVVHQSGLTALSADGQRPARFVSEVEIVNTHSGPLSWNNGIGRFAGVDGPIQGLLDHLRARRAGSADPGEPTGFCTHHLINEEDTWSFMEQLLAETTAHPAARWITLRDTLRNPFS